MRSRWIGWLGVVAVVAASSGCGGPQVKEFGKEDQEAIRALVADFGAAYNAKDAEKIASLFSGSAVLMPANRSTLRGIELLKSYYVERFEAGAGDLTLEPQDVSGQGALGFVTASFTLRVTPPEGGEPRNDRGKVLWIARSLAGGQWKFEYQIMSSDLPPVVPAPAAEPAK